MTDLQMGLIGFGGVAVLGVLAYNKWQERKHRKMAEKLLSARQTDVLLDEPGSASGGGLANEGAPPGDLERIEPLLRAHPDELREPDASAETQETASDGFSTDSVGMTALDSGRSSTAKTSIGRRKPS